MADIDPLTVLDNLSSEQYLKVLQDPPPDGSADQDFRTAFGAAIDRIATVWGEPDYLGGWDDENFPDWYDAVMMACWNRPGGEIAYLAYQWSGPEVPMLITLGEHRA